VGVAKFYLWQGEPESFTAFRTFALVAEVILGFLTFTGSLMAAGSSRSQVDPQRPVTYPFQNQVNIGLLLVAVACGFALVWKPVELATLFRSSSSSPSPSGSSSSSRSGGRTCRP